ncbi:MAG TPA: OmpA family protein [Bacteroidales bacterium]|nr:OmpA family protein [Bacteroidales bacterium]HPT21000.1 OmpA family protein [Bacteroidales bacterium]
MGRHYIFIIGLAALVTFSISCVSSKKYKSLQETSRQYMNERDDFRTDKENLEMKNRELDAKISSLNKEKESLKSNIEKVQAERDKALGDYNRLTSRYSELQNAQEDLIRGNVKETRKLLSELQAAQGNLQDKEDQLHQLEQTLDARKASLEELTFELDKKKERMAELENILEAQKKIAQDLKDKVSEALLGFENNGLTVTKKNGKVYVSLDEKLLFKSASWDIDVNGKNALKKLAGVLEKNPDIQVMIEGHTDNVPYNPGSGQLKDNWDLSVKRATTVVRVLLEGSRIDPKRLTASGRSQYLPVDEHNTAEAKQKNRRTEIILAPDLNELYKLIDQY